MIAFNHELFIKEAMKGVFMQRTSFQVELIICNDNSTDRTHAVIQEVIAGYSGNYSIKYFNHSQNLGMMKNFHFALTQCTGEYIAICEGDDYWTDSAKLERQTTFLDRNPDYSLCAHDAWVVFQGSDKKRRLFAGDRLSSETLSLKDIILSEWLLPTASLLFRTRKLSIPEWFDRIKNGDLAVQLLVASTGKVKVFRIPMSVYRRNATSVSSNLTVMQILSARKQLYGLFNVYTERKFERPIQRKLLQLRYQMLKAIFVHTMKRLVRYN
jgi:glycosyltransferase involved in cell wall biosynthesis